MKILCSPKGVLAFPWCTHSVPFLHEKIQNRRVAVALQAHMPVVHPEMTIWGGEGRSPPPFFWLKLILLLLRKECKNSKS